MINFIGLGAQKSGTSWVYSCLYEHPEICAPIKEIHFFSRERFEKGKKWYEDHFSKCAVEKLKGEFSTSYLYSRETPGRIRDLYPDTKLIAILRNPIDRAFSQYRNSIKAGEIDESLSFKDYCDQEESVVEQGKYYEQLKRYKDLFPREQILTLVYEDIKKSPREFMKSIYTFLEVDDSFVSSMLHRSVNTSRTPKRTHIDRLMRDCAEFLRRSGLDKLVWHIKKSGVPDFVRKVNTKETVLEINEEDKNWLKNIFKDDAIKLSADLNRGLVSEWKLL